MDGGVTDPIEAVLFDLDDTLFPQESWLSGAWVAVAEAVRTSGVDPTSFLVALKRMAAEGSGRGAIIDRALVAVGAAHVTVGPLVAVFREFEPGPLPPYPGVAERLRRLRAAVPIGLVSDGDVTIQRGKLRAVGLADDFDVIVWSDELGREHRKPAPTPFLRAAALLGVAPGRIVFVGDRPDKDVAGSLGVGMRPIRVQTGEYRADPDTARPWAVTADASEAIELLLGLMKDVRGMG